jgi:caffeoyl-CoA O-methyltransferase
MALPDEGKIIACDVSEEFTSVARPYWEEAGIAHKIDLRIGPASATLASLAQDTAHIGTFDFALLMPIKAATTRTMSLR